MNSSISLDKAIKHSVKEITLALDCEIIGIERVTKIYGSNANSFVLKTLNIENRLETYILKFSRKVHIEDEIQGDKLICKYLPTPALVLTSKKKSFGLEWALYEYIEGELMIEKFIDFELNGKSKESLILEIEKEKLLRKMHSLNKQIMFKDYLVSKTNLLFYQRINGERYKTFYQTTPNNISRYFNKKITINNHNFSQTIDEVFNQIRNKYISYKDTNPSLTAILGHGDAHHGNIIVNDKICFIDNEYVGYIPPFMELAKPYYNDFVGTLFFHYNDLLSEYFHIDSIKNGATSLEIKVSIPKKIKLRTLITEAKLTTRKSTVNSTSKDFLSLNDYLIMCHTLTKDPHNYSEDAQMMFLVFTLILANFDPFNPSSIYKFF